MLCCRNLHLGQVSKVRLSCYLVLLSNDSKTRYKTGSPLWPDPFSNWTGQHFTSFWICFVFLFRLIAPSLGSSVSHTQSWRSYNEDNGGFLDHVLAAIYIKNSWFLVIYLYSVSWIKKWKTNCFIYFSLGNNGITLCVEKSAGAVWVVSVDWWCKKQWSNQTTSVSKEFLLYINEQIYTLNIEWCLHHIRTYTWYRPIENCIIRMWISYTFVLLMSQ